MSKENKLKSSKLHFIGGFILVVFLMGFFGVSMFSQGISGAFVWDDFFLMKHPFYLRLGFGVDSVLGPVLTNPALFWRPIGMLTIGSQWDLTADAIFAKKVNILFILLFCLSLLSLLFFEARKLLSLKMLSFTKKHEYVLTLLLLVGLFFLVLPSNQVGSAFISSRFSVLGGLCIIWAVICIRYLHGWGAFLGAGMFYALSLLSVESALALLPVLLMLSFLRSKEYETLKHLNAMNAIDSQEDPLELGFIDYLNYQIKNYFFKYLSITLLIISFLYLAFRFYFLGSVFVVSDNLSFWGVLANSGAFFYAPLAHWSVALPGVVVPQWQVMSVVFVFIGFIIFSLKRHQKSLFALSGLLHEILSTVSQKKQSTNLMALKSTVLPSGLKVDNEHFVFLKRQALNTIHYVFLMISMFVASVIACAIVMNWSIPKTYILYSTDVYVIAPIIYLLLFVSIIHLLNSLGLNKDYIFLKNLVLERQETREKKEIEKNENKNTVECKSVICVKKGSEKAFDFITKLGLGFIISFLMFGIFLGVSSMKQTQEAWKSSENLWNSAHNYSINVGEVNALADMNLMILLSQRKASVDKIKSIGEALWVKLSTKSSLLRHELASIATYGALLTEYGEESKATAMLTIIMPKSASEPLVAINLARSALKAQKTIEALGALNFALDNYKKSWTNDKQAVLLYGMRSEIYANLGEKQKSEEDLRHSNKILENVKQKDR